MAHKRSRPEQQIRRAWAGFKVMRLGKQYTHKMLRCIDLCGKWGGSASGAEKMNFSAIKTASSNRRFGKESENETKFKIANTISKI